MQTTVLEDQSLLDMTIQMGGSLESVFDLALQNNMSITNQIETGLSISLESISDNRIVNYYNTNKLTPATAIVETQTKGGIGYMAVGIDFIVS